MTENDGEELRSILHELAVGDPADAGLAARAKAQAHRMRRGRRIGYGVAAAASVAVLSVIPVSMHLRSTPPDGHGVATAPEQWTCPVTSAASDGEVPKALSRLGGDWVGRGALWVRPPTVAVSPGSTRLKYGVFTLDARGQMSDTAGRPSVTAQRVDGHGSATGDRTDYSSTTGPHGEAVHFWPTTITVPSSGCWALTEKLSNTTVRFVVRVGDAPRSAASHP